jgi:hypothetical protein
MGLNEEYELGRKPSKEKMVMMRVRYSDVKVLFRYLGELNCTTLGEGFHTLLLNHLLVSNYFDKEVVKDV